MRCIPVDPRTTSWEIDDPQFRVVIYRPLPQGNGHRTETFVVTASDVVEVVEWARSQSTASADATVHLEVTLESGELGLVYLWGHDPLRG